MAVTIRLARHGRKKIPFYRMVAADKEMKRDGRFLEILGTVNPLSDPPTVLLKEDRVKHWVDLGAEASDTAYDIIEKQIPGYLSSLITARRTKLQAARKARKLRAPKAESKKTKK